MSSPPRPTPGSRFPVPVVVTTGSESTGKTALAAHLARHYGTVWVPEFVRGYLDAKTASSGLTLDATDVEPIAHGQIALQDRALAEARGLAVFDTDIVSTVIYARHYYGSSPPWIEEAARARLGDLYLLCDIDLAWEADPQRDRPDRREHMHGLFADTLRSLGARVEVIRGAGDVRHAAAIAAVDALVRR